MGKSSNKSTQTQTFNQTTTPNVPTTISQPFDQFNQQVSGLMGTNKPFVAGASGNQQLAFDNAPGLLNAGSGYFDTAAQLGLGALSGGANTTGPAATANAGSASAKTFNQADLAPILNTYLTDVVDASLGDYDQGVARAQSEQSRLAALNGGARNGNNAVASALLAAEAQRGRASTAADLRYGAYDRAASILGQDNDRLAGVSMANANNATQANVANANAANNMAMFNASQADNALNRQLQAAGLFGNLGTTAGSEARQNLGLLSDLGAQERNINNAQNQEDYARLAALQSLLGYNPALLIGQSSTGNSRGTTTQTQSGLGGVLGSLGGLASGLGALGWSPFGAS